MHASIWTARSTRSAVICDSCSKPRAISNTTALTSKAGMDLLGSLEEYLSECEYCCGDDAITAFNAAFVDPGVRGLANLKPFAMKRGITCGMQVACDYYNAKAPYNRHFAQCCIWCGYNAADTSAHVESAELLAREILDEGQKLLRPICRACLDNGRKPDASTASKRKANKAASTHSSKQQAVLAFAKAGAGAGSASGTAAAIEVDSNTDGADDSDE